MQWDWIAAGITTMYHWLAWGLGTGLSPVLPGSCGTLAGVLLYIGLPAMSRFHYLLLIGLLFVAGIGISGLTARDMGLHDPAAIVWDEIVAFLAVMISAQPGWLRLAAGFALFRLLDIAKPWPVDWLDRHLGGGFGIMADDMLAAAYAWLVIQLMCLLVRTKWLNR